MSRKRSASAYIGIGGASSYSDFGNASGGGRTQVKGTSCSFLGCFGAGRPSLVESSETPSWLYLSSSLSSIRDRLRFRSFLPVALWVSEELELLRSRERGRLLRSAEPLEGIVSPCYSYEEYK